MIQVNSFSDLTAKIQGKEKAYLLLYKSGSEKSDCAYDNISSAAKGVEGIHTFCADVATVRDIHPQYNITTAPALLEFENGNFKHIVKGCNNASHYKALFEDAVYYAATKNDDKPTKRVTVYSTPTCSWCTTLKSYLKKNKIRFTDVDVSRDQGAAENMVKRSGQQGVPQTDINGEMIVGFNKARINELLGIKG